MISREEDNLAAEGDLCDLLAAIDATCGPDRATRHEPEDDDPLAVALAIEDVLGDRPARGAAATTEHHAAWSPPAETPNTDSPEPETRETNDGDVRAEPGVSVASEPEDGDPPAAAQLDTPAMETSDVDPPHVDPAQVQPPQVQPPQVQPPQVQPPQVQASGATIAETRAPASVDPGASAPPSEPTSGAASVAAPTTPDDTLDPGAGGDHVPPTPARSEDDDAGAADTPADTAPPVGVDAHATDTPATQRATGRTDDPAPAAPETAFDETTPSGTDDPSAAADDRGASGWAPEPTLRQLDDEIADDVEQLLHGNFDTVSEVLDNVIDTEQHTADHTTAADAATLSDEQDAADPQPAAPPGSVPIPERTAPPPPPPKAEKDRSETPESQPAESAFLPSREPPEARTRSEPEPEPETETEGILPDPRPPEPEAVDLPEIETLGDETDTQPASVVHEAAPPAGETALQRVIRLATPVAVTMLTMLNLPLRFVPERYRPVVDWIALTLVFWVPIVWVVALFLVGG